MGMEEFAVAYEAGSGDAVAKFGLYEIWRKPAGEFGTHDDDELQNYFAAALRAALAG